MLSIRTKRVWVCLVFVALPGLSYTQENPSTDLIRGPFSNTPIVNAPFSAEAMTIVTEKVENETRTSTGSARYYRDSMGRVRVEYEVPLAESHEGTKTVAMILPDPIARKVYTVDQATETIRQSHLGIAGVIFNGADAFAIATGRAQFRVFYAVDIDAPDNFIESLGNRRIAGILTEGRRVTSAALGGRFDELWESRELQVVIHAIHSDPSTKIQIDYRLSNISRTDPAPELFVLPSNYTMIEGRVHNDPLLSLQSP